LFLPLRAVANDRENAVFLTVAQVPRADGKVALSSDIALLLTSAHPKYHIPGLLKAGDN